MKFYPFLFRAVLCRFDPEFAHHLAVRAIRVLRWVSPKPVRSAELEVRALGLVFPTPFGLAAGFDKNATAVAGLARLGFGHIEVGTLTPIAQPGNPKPRLFRLTSDRALINRMGFNNSGIDDAVSRLRRLKPRLTGTIVGVNIGKNKETPPEEAGSDYENAALAIRDVADYLVVNVSSPNTPGLRALQARDLLGPLLRRTQVAAGGVPVLVKLAPDLSNDEISELCELVVELKLDGIVAANTTLSREGLHSSKARVSEIGPGGLSGLPLAHRALEVLKLIRSQVPESLCVISVGGVFTAKDVSERLTAGATLVQGYTGFVYQGPGWARSINQGLLRLMRNKSLV